ncbi:MAG TPA: alpha/beta hydrolase-fold protein [Solimonas sp.]|nr:alpha/beta hydrolase-fold protein [Solimonas sp.]
MTSELRQPFLIGLDDAACLRLADVQRHSLAVCGVLREVRVALPKSYAGAKRRRYPLVILLDADGIFGSAVEMSRLMSDTQEIRECIVIGLPRLGGDASAEAAGKLAAAITGEVLSWCKGQFRIEEGAVALSGAGTATSVVLHALLAGIGGIEHFIIGEQDFERCAAVALRFQPRGGRSGRRLALTVACGEGKGRALATAWRELGVTLATLAGGELSVSVHPLDDVSASTVAVPALLQGLRQFWSTGKEYGSNVTFLRKPLMQGVLGLLSPLFRRLQRAPLRALDAGNPWLLRSERMARNFEVFVALPASFQEGAARRYPALLVLDANIEFSTVAETAARMAAAGEIAEMIVIGVGTPRSEGPKEFGFRRFEEFSPPADGYAWDDELGHLFRSLFSMRGQDARERIGQGPGFLGFLAEELLPRLQDCLPIDGGDLGLLGHSAGGTFVAWALQQQESPFRRYFAVSPGVGISGSWLMRQPDDRVFAPGADSVVLTLGSEEKTNLFNRIAGIHETEALARRLRAVQPQLQLQFRCFEGETHSSIYPRAVVLSLAAGYALRRGLPESLPFSAAGAPAAA